MSEENRNPEELATQAPAGTQKKSKKPLIAGICAVVAIVIVAIVAVQVVIPLSNYNAAEKAFEDGDYAAAAEKYQALGDYKDAPDKADLAVRAGHYQAAEAAFNAGDFNAAHDEFVLSGNYQDASARAAEAVLAGHYANGEKALQSGSYTQAIEAFQQAGSYQDAAGKVLEAYYGLGMSNMDSKAYESAIEAFQQAGNYQDAAGKVLEAYFGVGMSCMDAGEYDQAEAAFISAEGYGDSANMLQAVKLMQAEETMAEGRLNTARAMFQELPSGFSYNGVSVDDRLAALERHSSFVALCGQWNSTDMDASVRQTHVSTGLWDQWDGDGTNYKLTITCVINDDDTVTMTAKAAYWMYINYSSLSKNLKTLDMSKTFTYTGTSVPSVIEDGSSKLTISGQTFKFNYQLVDKNSSMNFNYTFKSFGTYDKLVEAY